MYEIVLYEIEYCYIFHSDNYYDFYAVMNFSNLESL